MKEETHTAKSEILYALSIPTKDSLLNFLKDFRHAARREMRDQIATQTAALAALYYDLYTLCPTHESLMEQNGRTAMEMAIADIEYGAKSQPRYELQGVIFAGLPVDPIYLRVTPKSFTSLLTSLGARPTRMSLSGGRPETFLEISAPEIIPLLPDAIISLLPPVKRRSRAIAGILETDADNIIVRLKQALTPDDLFLIRKGNPK